MADSSRECSAGVKAMMATSTLDAEFFARDTLRVARDLIGAILVVGDCAARIVETEAYTTDPASHSITRRHAASIMRDSYGHVYVYRIYGIHHCVNITTEREGAGAVLLRAAEPIRGLDQMACRRGLSDVRALLRGPGRLCQALAIDSEHHGHPIGGLIRLEARVGKPAISSSPRVGIRKAVDLEWRFFETGNPFVSGPVFKREVRSAGRYPAARKSNA